MIDLFCVVLGHCEFLFLGFGYFLEILLLFVDVCIFVCMLMIIKINERNCLDVSHFASLDADVVGRFLCIVVSWWRLVYTIDSKSWPVCLLCICIIDLIGFGLQRQHNLRNDFEIYFCKNEDTLGSAWMLVSIFCVKYLFSINLRMRSEILHFRLYCFVFHL